MDKPAVAKKVLSYISTLPSGREFTLADIALDCFGIAGYKDPNITQEWKDSGHHAQAFMYEIVHGSRSGAGKGSGTKCRYESNAKVLDKFGVSAAEVEAAGRIERVWRKTLSTGKLAMVNGTFVKV